MLFESVRNFMFAFVRGGFLCSYPKGLCGCFLNLLFVSVLFNEKKDTLVRNVFSLSITTVGK